MKWWKQLSWENWLLGISYAARMNKMIHCIYGFLFISVHEGTFLESSGCFDLCNKQYGICQSSRLTEQILLNIFWMEDDIVWRNHLDCDIWALYEVSCLYGFLLK